MKRWGALGIIPNPVRPAFLVIPFYIAIYCIGQNIINFVLINNS